MLATSLQAYSRHICLVLAVALRNAYRLQTGGVIGMGRELLEGGGGGGGGKALRCCCSPGSWWHQSTSHHSQRSTKPLCWPTVSVSPSMARRGNNTLRIHTAIIFSAECKYSAMAECPRGGVGGWGGGGGSGGVSALRTTFTAVPPGMGWLLSPPKMPPKESKPLGPRPV